MTRDREAEMTTMRALAKMGMFLMVLSTVVVLSGCGSNPVSSTDPGNGSYVPPNHAGAKGDSGVHANGGGSQQ